MVEAVRISSRIAAPAADVWARATSPEGINDELRPWLQMTVPRRMRETAISDLKAPARLGRSWILFLGVVPFDYDDLHLAEIGPGYRFVERSQLLSMRAWEHERAVVPAGEGECEVSDRIAFELHRPLAALGLTRPVAGILRALFARRHRRLVGYFGGQSG